MSNKLGARLQYSEGAREQAKSKLALYANVGSELLHFDVDVTSAGLVRRSAIKLPGNVQYGWPHRSGRYLYVATSNNATTSAAGQHHVVALRIDPLSGELREHGDPVALPVRPIDMSTDVPSDHLLVAFPIPSGVQVFRLNADGAIGEELSQPGVVDGGYFAHQIRVTPDNRHAILVTRGHALGRPDDPGALKVFDYDRGLLSNELSVAPDEGRHFSPRNLDVHATRPWVFLVLEKENKICMHRLDNGSVEPEAAYQKDTLKTPGDKRPRQMAGAVHLHPNGRFVYVANRADSTVDFNGKKVFAGGENNIAVYEIDQTTGEPRLIQHADTRKIHPRTFHIDPGGELMVVQHNLPANVRDNDEVRVVPAGLTVFRIGADGRLAFVDSYDIDVGDETMFWMGMVQPSATGNVVHV